MTFKTGLEKLKKPFLRKKRAVKVNEYLQVQHLKVKSKALKRKVQVDVYLPARFERQDAVTFPALLLNDGQDGLALDLSRTLTQWYRANQKPSVIVVAVYAGDRIQEYGTAGIPDYKNRGSKAQQYTEFIIERLIPYLQKNYNIFQSSEKSVIAGFSLGGLSAMDIAWKHSHLFSKVGVFSGSFWWRSKPIKQDPDADRIMHDIIKQSHDKLPLKFWLQAGTQDEQSDRNNNGVIDAIDDTLDVIKELKSKGLSDDDITYVEIEGGEHNFHTWSRCFPDFLEWGFDD